MTALGLYTALVAAGVTLGGVHVTLAALVQWAAWR